MPCIYDIAKNLIDVGTPISDKMLKEEAKYFYKKITLKDNFQASDCWLDKFKNCFGGDYCV